MTDSDRASEDFLVARISERYPSHAIIAEEGSRKEADGGYLWYVDPLDGTNNFAHGLPLFCVSIGVFSLSENTVVAGAVYNPFLDEMFTAARGREPPNGRYSAHAGRYRYIPGSDGFPLRQGGITGQ